MENLDKFIEACQKSATACLFENDVQNMRKCILLSRECSAMCLATARIMSVGVARFEMLFRACEEMCVVCAKENGLHANLWQCKQAAEACRNCAELCRKLQPELVS